MLCPTMTSASSCCSLARRKLSSPRSDDCEESTTEAVRLATGLLAFSCDTAASQPGGKDTPSSLRTTEKCRRWSSEFQLGVG